MILCASLLLALSPRAGGPPQESAAPEMLGGVTEIAPPGTSGSVCAFGPNSAVLVAGGGGVPVMALAQGGAAGAGRVLALGHDGWIAPAALRTESTARFLENALRWLGGARRPRIGCPGQPQLAAALEELGLRAADAGDLSALDCVVLDGGKELSHARTAELQAFVRGGGGLLVAATGWGWQQGHAGAVLARDLPGNRLLVPFGLAFGLETAAPASGAGFATAPAPDPLCHAGRAFARLQEDPPPGPERELAVARVRAALDALPDHEPLLMVPLRRILESGALADDSPFSALVAPLAARELRPLGERWGEWHALGPFPHPAGARDVAPPHPPERALLELHADGPDPDLTASFDHGRVAWRAVEVPGDGHALDVGELRFDAWWPRADVERAAVYLWRRVELDGPLELACRAASDDGLRLWCDGQLLVDRSSSHGLEGDDIPLTLSLAPGVHHLVAKVTNEDGAFGFRLRGDEPRDQAAVDRAIDAGVKDLLGLQQVDGSWAGWPEYGPGYTAFCLYTLARCGVPADDPALRRGLAWLLCHPTSYTYSQGFTVLALAAIATPEALAALPDAVKSLEGMQDRTGLWSYPVHPEHHGTEPDLSNALVAALALRAAREHGIEADASLWRDMAEGALLCWRGEDDVQARRGDPEPAGFSYSTQGNTTGSMTTAGIAVLTIARDALGKHLDRRLAKRLDLADASAIAWIERNWTLDANPGDGRFQYFWLYGVERLGALLHRDVLASHDWYWSGAEYLVQHQQGDGGWTAAAGGDGRYDTPLALLFLARATAPTSGRSRSRADVHVAEGPELDAWLRGQGENPLALWVSGYGRRVRAEDTWPGENEPRVQRVRYLARRPGGGEVVLGEVEPRSGASVQRFECKARFPGAGHYDVRAELEVSLPPAAAGLAPETATITSGELHVEVPAAADPAALSYPLDAARNLLHGAHTEESSHYLDQSSDKAVDGLAETRWHCDIADAHPWWRATLPRPVEADRLYFSHAWPRLREAGNPQPARIDVILDGEEPLSLAIDPDPLKKTELVLPAPRKVRTVEVRIVESRARTLGRDAVGFSEIELELGPRGR